MRVDFFSLTHIKYLFQYCKVHRNCEKCHGTELCKKFEEGLYSNLRSIQEDCILSEESLLVLLNHWEHCFRCNRCTFRCKRKTECDRIMTKVVEDHKKKKWEKIKEEKKGAKGQEKKDPKPLAP